MQNINCTTYGHEPSNGATKSTRFEPPPEVANWVITSTPPELLTQLRETFDEAEFIAALREVERTGGVQIDELIDEIEPHINGSV